MPNIFGTRQSLGICILRNPKKEFIRPGFASQKINTQPMSVGRRGRKPVQNEKAATYYLLFYLPHNFGIRPKWVESNGQFRQITGRAGLLSARRINC